MPALFDCDAYCVHCRRSGGVFYLATYAGCQEGGVPVHVGCINEFYAAIDARSPFEYADPYD
jgi:hypothetical protein